MGAEMRGEPAHLRTRVERGGMNYKGYNIAVHEMCHNVEQTFSLNDVDYYSLHGVPNTAFTEALAFTCQDRDLELLGLGKPDAQSRALEALDTFWGTYEIGGVGAGGHAGVALDVRASAGHCRRAARSGAGHCARHLESLVCAGVRRARRDAAGHLFAHDQRDAVPARLLRSAT